jgi:hypothetical protein
MPPGTPWGGKWEYGWFKGKVVVPQEMDGKRLAIQVRPNARQDFWAVSGESLVWVNGKVMGSVGWGHREMTLTESARPGEEFDIASGSLCRARAHAGMHQWPDHADPVRLWPRSHRCRLAVAAAGDRAQDGPHRHQPAGPDEEYPEFKFLQSQPHLYWMLQQRYPELYERFKAAIKSGA